ncbi:MAG: MerR family transcriptional regulator [Sphingomonadales bacterium]|jgi:DNA-binding transcriptional MerR regulator|nr:MerR family transcriptional regulator [Sphingomonadales bacterium]MBK9004506.1 MerR family transcriptional regulator [Sphingomonadales bacterium]MBK9269693.1 MerR family transcriptional regulator [Sphingomonadales bacterium]MBP6433366.1 MerR family transcriptional regulator [Sphingorhabdus sp.]
MDKAPEAFLTIGEMADRLGVKTHILRYWEEQFPMLKPLKRAGGRRLYRPSDVALLDQIQDLLSKQGYTIRGARAYLVKGGKPEMATSPVPASAIEAASAPAGDLVAMPASSPLVPELRAIRDRLAQALAVA